MRTRVLVCLLTAAAFCATVAAGAAPTAEPRVLVIGDSVATGMYWHDDAIAAMQKNLAVYWQVAVCRTLTGTSCPFDGGRPPTLLDTVETLGHVPPIVVLVMGYNDPAPTFPAAVDDSLAALTKAGAKHVLWLTLHAVRDPYPELNTDLEQARMRWPQLELVDWNEAGAGHPAWFQSDGVHLLDSGGLAMAHLAHAAVIRLVDPLRIVTTLRLRDGRTSTLRLHARGGTPPYSWRVARGRPPKGFHLARNGAVVARPPSTARARFTIGVTDADGATAFATVATR